MLEKKLNEVLRHYKRIERYSDKFDDPYFKGLLVSFRDKLDSYLNLKEKKNLEVKKTEHIPDPAEVLVYITSEKGTSEKKVKETMINLAWVSEEAANKAIQYAIEEKFIRRDGKKLKRLIPPLLPQLR